MNFYNKAVYILKEILFPKKCMCCGKYIHYTNKYFICEECYKNQAGKYKSLFEKYAGVNFDIDNVYYAVKYAGTLKKAFIKMKFGGKKFYADTFARMLYEHTKGADFLDSVDVITCVPMSKSRLKRRGYNQSDVVAKSFSEYTGHKYNNTLLFKLKNLPPLSKMKKAERFKQIIGAFGYNDENILFDAHVLLIDDIYTTGATTGECAKILKSKGVDRVTVLTIFSNEY